MEVTGADSYVYLSLGSDSLVARTPALLAPPVGAIVSVWLDLEHVHCFDPATGTAVGACLLIYSREMSSFMPMVNCSTTVVNCMQAVKQMIVLSLTVSHEPILLSRASHDIILNNDRAVAGVLVVVIYIVEHTMKVFIFQKKEQPLWYFILREVFFYEY